MLVAVAVTVVEVSVRVLVVVAVSVVTYVVVDVAVDVHVVVVVNDVVRVVYSVLPGLGKSSTITLSYRVSYEPPSPSVISQCQFNIGVSTFSWVIDAQTVYCQTSSIYHKIFPRTRSA